MGRPILSRRKPAKKLRPLLREVATAFPHSIVELWAVDEHRIGLKPHPAQGLVF
jgi:hypothetical protein